MFRILSQKLTQEVYKVLENTKHSTSIITENDLGKNLKSHTIKSAEFPVVQTEIQDSNPTKLGTDNPELTGFLLDLSRWYKILDFGPVCWVRINQHSPRCGPLFFTTLLKLLV